MAIPYTPTRFGDYQSQRQSAEVQSVIDTLNELPWFKGREVSADLAGGSNTVVDHGLGRVPTGFLVLKFSGAAASDYPRWVSATDRQLTLTVTAAATATLWVY